METYSDIELFAFLRVEDGGDRRVSEAAFKEIYNRLSPRIYAYCRRVLSDAERAQDVFQDTFVRFYNSAQKEREMTNVPAFLLRIARNLCLNAKRDNQQHIHVSFEDYHYADHDDKLENKELVGLITKALDYLSPEYREVFVLREYDGMSYAEIGEIVGISEATAKIRSFRAKNKLREILAPYLADLEK
ncbi:MAG: RNA polymerase sigma factor [Candidatus Kapabacteria bacterium]|nr:RNA polymerase sigma factor [Candidatus Kapabacteria bacterium]